MTHRKLLYSALALVMAAAMLLSPAPPTAQAAPAGQDAPRAPDVTLNIDNTLAGPIPDGTAATGTGCSNWPFTRYFLVTQHISITDLNLGVNLDHVNRGQIRGKLTAPDGTSYEVIATSADTNNNYDILLDGDSGGALDNNADDNTASPYYTRTVLQTALNNFDGKDAFGGWQLFLCDNTLNGGTDNDGSFNRAQLQITGDVIAFTPPTHQQGPPIVETYYMPWPEDQLWTAMGLIFGPGRAVPGDDTCTDFGGYDANPRQPMINYSSITVSYANTVVTYDQWEDGYEAVITFPTQSTTEVWGDGNLLNGTAPGDADDLLVVGQVLILNDVMDSSTLQSVIDYDARDKIAASTPIAVSRALWSDGSKTLFAHVDEVYPTSFWGTDYRLPVGENADLNEMFQYTGVSVMAAVDGTVVSIDKDANGTAEQTCNLNQGQSCQWTDTYVGGVIGSGLNRNSRITSNSGHPIQVSLLTADYCAGFETRSFPLLPVDKWSNSYYNPVGTLTANGGPGADEAPTYVHLYNPNASTLTVSYAFSTGAVNTVSVPANSGANVTMTNLEGAHFYTTSGANFFAVATVDSENAPDHNTSDRNDRYDWGITLVPERFMSQWLIVGWAPGDDPAFLGTGSENTAPIWLTGGHPTGSSTPAATFDVCIDDGGNGGALTDPVTGRTYDRKITGVAPRTQRKVYNGGTAVAGQDQTAMQLWVCGPTITTPDAMAPNATVLDSDAILTAAWGEDPLTAAPASPAMDMGDTIRNGPRWTVTKDVSLWDDVNDNGLYDEGDTVRYTITVQNQGASILPINFITVVDTPDPGTTYVLNSTTVNFGSGASPIPDNGVGTPFPLDTPGYPNGTAIPVNGSMTIVFDAEIDADTAATTLCNGVAADDSSVEQAAQACLFVQEPVLGAIGNYVWFDEDGDGDQDAGEYGIPNVQVELWEDTDGNGSYDTLVATTYTDANGGYLFPGLDPGNYRVDVIASTLPDPDGAGPGGLHQTYDEDNGTGPFTTPHSTPVSLGSGEEHLSADFGYNWAPPGDTNNPPLGALGAIGDRVWIDSDGDGVQDMGEAGIPNVPVQLWYDSDGDGDIDTQLSSTTTNAAGYYIFDQLPAGIYEVRVNNGAGVAGYTQTGDPDQFGATCTACDNKTTTPIVLGPGDVFLNADFGYQPATSFSIGNTVFFDVDADGTYEPNGNDGNAGTSADNEYGIPGVTVALIRDNGDGVYNPADDPIVATTITGDDPSTPAVVETGWYGFSGLPGGTQYFVWVNDTENVLGEVEQSGEPGPTDGGVACVACNDRSPAVVPVGPNTVLQDFGYTPIDQGNNFSGAIGDTVFLDANNDGLFQPGEGIEGVVVALFDDQGNKLAQTTTDENGRYYFGNLDPNNVTYVVQVQTGTLPNGGVGLTNHVDPDDASPGDSFSTWTLTPAAPINLNQDFGYRPTTSPGSIGNYIWEDTNADGVNNEPAANGIGGVTVDLYEDNNGNGIIDSGDHLIGQTTTAANGSYLFQNLPPGNYLVDVTDDAQVLNGYWHSLGNQAQGADNNSKQDPHKVTLAAGQNYVAADFGYYVEPAAVGNFVWLDSDQNGIQDVGEAGIPNVVVKMIITYPNGDTTTLTAVTDSTGYYSFGNLLQDEDYNGASTYGAEPTYSISIDTTQPALAGSPYPTLINAAGSTVYNDSDNPAGTPAQPVQGQTNTSFANDLAGIASYDFGFSTTPLSVFLAGFDAASQADHVLVSWETVSEASNSGFNLYRSLSVDGEYALLGFTPSAAPGSTAGAAYSYQDFDVAAGQTYWYKLEDVDLSGAATLHGPVSVVFQAPTAVELDTLAADGGASALALPWLLAALLAAGAAALLVDRRRRNAA